MIDDLRQIAIFAKTVELGSFRAAAEDLKLSPSVVSHHISQLEQKLGLALLYRTTRRLSLTQDGEKLLAMSEGMLRTVEEGLNAIKERADDPSGALRLSLPSVLSNSQLVRALGRFAKAYPKVSLEIDFSDERKNLVRDGYDLAIRIGPKRKRGPARKSLFQMRRLLVASQSYLEQTQSIMHPNDLNRVDWIDFTPARRISSRFHKRGEADVSVSTKAQVSVNDAQAMTRLVLDGVGIGFVPEFLIADQLATGEVRQVLSDWNVDALDVYAEWPNSAPRQSLPTLLAGFLAKEMAK